MIRLSKHVTDEMAGRRIRLVHIENTLTAPDWVTPDATSVALTRSFKVIKDFGNRILRVVHRPEGADTFVVTAHWDRGAKR